MLYTGGQQAYYSTADPVLTPVQENRITISGTGGLADDVIYSGLAAVSIHLGGGANHVTVDTTPFGPISRGTGGNASGTAVITSHTGADDDHDARRRRPVRDPVDRGRRHAEQRRRRRHGRGRQRGGLLADVSAA